MSKLPIPISFDWDKGNIDKNWEKHVVTNKETEEVFFNKPLKVFPDLKHSEREERFIALGVSNKRQDLAIVFTIRNNGSERIRVISARKQNKKERKTYEKK